MQVRNPRTGKYDYEFSLLKESEIKFVCDSLRQEQPYWASLPVNGRIEIMQQWKHKVEKHKEQLIDSLRLDTGRNWETLLEAELVATSIDRWCGIAKEFFQTASPKNSSIPFIKLQQHLVPYQLIGVISPWNFPLLLSLIDTIPALLAGSAVLVKPSEITPRFAEVIQQTINAVPILKKVFKYLQGDGSTGAAMVEHCDLICFTGSTSTGKKVYSTASKRMIPVFLELGGKDPAIVLEGADIDAASSAILWGSTANAGQSCLSIERVYVQETVFENFIEQLSKKASAVKLAYPDMNDGTIGPIILEKQVKIINDHLADAISKGAFILTGSQQCEELGGGWYCKPTVLVNVTHEMKLMQEESFGPLIPVMKFATKEEAVELANGTIYGLSAAVFAKTKEEAMELGAKIESGAISINDAALTAVMHEGEKNSFKLSGIGGTRMGPSAIKRFMRQKVFIIKDDTVKSPWWYRNPDE